METTRETLCSQFAALNELVAGLEHGRRSWYDFWPMLADIQSVIHQRQPGGNCAADASLELGRVMTAARSRDVKHVRISLHNAQIMLKLLDIPAKGYAASAIAAKDRRLSLISQQEGKDTTKRA